MGRYIITDKIGNLSKLTILTINNNKLISIPSTIGNLTNLSELLCNTNELFSIPPTIGQLTQLQKFNCSYNSISRFPAELGNLTNLTKFYFGNNPIDYIPPNLNRLIELRKNFENTYNDNQNVHNHNIQKCTREAIVKIMNVKPIQNIKSYIQDNDILKQDTKNILFKYIDDNEIHSILNVTFCEVLSSIFSIIEANEHKNNILSIMNDDVNDLNDQCFTGRMTRIINCLSGFDDRVVLNITDKEQIGNIIILIKKQLEEQPNCYGVLKYTVDLHKKIVTKELLDRGFDENLVKEYINYIE